MSVNYSFFIQKFPEVELPLTLVEDAHHDFAKENEPLPTTAIEQYIAFYEATEPSEFVEYVPCFRLPRAKEAKFDALVYWRADLLSYDYVLATYDIQSGKMIDKRAIAGTQVVGNTVRRVAATIDDKRNIFIVEGGSNDGNSYDALNSKAQQLELLENGKIE
jgi:hypothetical protein